MKKIVLSAMTWVLVVGGLGAMCILLLWGLFVPALILATINALIIRIILSSDSLLPYFGCRRRNTLAGKGPRTISDDYKYP